MMKGSRSPTELIEHPAAGSGKGESFILPNKWYSIQKLTHRNLAVHTGMRCDTKYL